MWAIFSVSSNLCHIVTRGGAYAVNEPTREGGYTTTLVINSPQLFFSLKFNSGKMMGKKTGVSFPEVS